MEVVIVISVSNNVPRKYFAYIRNTQDDIVEAKTKYLELCNEIQYAYNEKHLTDDQQQIALDDGYWEVSDETVSITWAENNPITL